MLPGRGVLLLLLCVTVPRAVPQMHMHHSSLFHLQCVARGPCMLGRVIRAVSGFPPFLGFSVACAHPRPPSLSLLSLLLRCCSPVIVTASARPASTRHSCHLCPNLLRMRTHAGQMTHAFMHTQTRGTQSQVSSSCFATAHRSFALSLADQAVVWSSGHTGHRRPDGRRRTACPLMSFLLIALSTSHSCLSCSHSCLSSRCGVAHRM